MISSVVVLLLLLFVGAILGLYVVRCLHRIRLDITEHHGAMVRYRRTLDVRRVARKAAKALLVSHSLNFGLGLARTEDLLSSLVSYSKARLKYFQTIYEYNLAVGRLSRAVGVELSVPAPVQRE